MALHMLCPGEPGGLEKDVHSVVAGWSVSSVHGSNVFQPLPPY